MGTSNAYGGPGGGTPLIPSWLEPDTPSAPPAAPADDAPPPPDGAPPPTMPALPAAAPAGRFTAPRTSFTKFAASGGRDRVNLGRAVSGYVSGSSGGARQAARRMGSSRGATAGLVNFLADAANRGVREALRSLNLDALAGRPIEEVFIGLMEHICPQGGSVDEGIARDAFIETIAELAEHGVTDLDSLTADQVQTVFELYATHAIEARLCNDVGTKAITMPANAAEAQSVQDQLHDFIQRGVADALAGVGEALRDLSPDRTQALVDNVYQSAFEILQTMGEGEAARR
ncbi:MAG: hypothetical protein HY859_18885 [Caulobacterales bacterium]|nr:hypothetical protein [Caulobacterales bacterium]